MVLSKNCDFICKKLVVLIPVNVYGTEKTTNDQKRLRYANIHTTFFTYTPLVTNLGNNVTGTLGTQTLGITY